MDVWCWCIPQVQGQGQVQVQTDGQYSAGAKSHRSGFPSSAPSSLHRRHHHHNLTLPALQLTEVNTTLHRAGSNAAPELLATHLPPRLRSCLAINDILPTARDSQYTPDPISLCRSAPVTPNPTHRPGSCLATNITQLLSRPCHDRCTFLSTSAWLPAISRPNSQGARAISLPSGLIVRCKTHNYHALPLPPLEAPSPPSRTSLFF
ncbi:uncharacterized protein J3D65DRAFT_208863 [Phyllosticta citribraziliensis]|uniref:Uncharacterized protein n=1 Tax=Phyllosticta citribraziliensis TaxID=989973 RepID=A0ABR1M3X4_9PEZI